MLRKTFHGDKARWKAALDHITNFSEVKGDERDLIYLEHLIKNEPPPVYTTEDKVAVDKAVRRLKARIKEDSSKYALLHDAYEKLETVFNNAMIFDELRLPDPIAAPKRHQPAKAVGFLQFSDWHVGETVDSDVVNGLNKYSPRIARSRVLKLIDNSISIIRKEKSSSLLDKIVIQLGGDFINGWIHGENLETNSMTPSQEVEFAAELLGLAIRSIREHTGIPIVLVCNVGNHGRYTKRFRFANEIHTSFETLLYNILCRELKDEVEIIPPTSTLMYYDVMGQKCRFFHGHQVRYKDGVGGLTIPLNKREARWDETTKANFNFMGHYHTCSMPNSRTLLNGSLVGYNGLALFAGFAYEPPQQSFILYHSKYGWTSFQKVAAY